MSGRDTGSKKLRDLAPKYRDKYFLREGAVGKPGDVAAAYAKDVAVQMVKGANVPPGRQRELMVENVVSQARNLPKGRVVQEDGRVVSARLNPEAAVEAIGDYAAGKAAANPDGDLRNLLSNLDNVIGPETGGRRQRGGDGGLLDIMTDLTTDNEKIAVIKTIVQMAAYNAVWLAGEIPGPAGAYVYQELCDPLLKQGAKLANIGVRLANQLFRVPVTLTLLSTSGIAAGGNFAGELLSIFNTWGRETADWMTQESTAKQAAAAAVKDARAIVTTTGVVAITANQLGLLPLSAILAAILFSVQNQFGTGAGRAYVVQGFYTWYLSQSVEDKKEIIAAASQYAQATGVAAKKSAAATKTAATAAAKKLGPLLMKVGKVAGASVVAGAGATGNAFKAVGEALRSKQSGAVEVKPIESAAVAAGETALTEAAPAAGIAASTVMADSTSVTAPAEAKADVQVTAVAAAVEQGQEAAIAGTVPEQVVVVAKKTRLRKGAPEFAPGGPGGRRKTKKRVSKRRVTRRRKAQKILGTPVFIY